MKKLKVAIVMPNQADINSSLNNYLKMFKYLVLNKNIEITLFTDKRNHIDYKYFKIKKINGLDYNTPFVKLFFLLGIPRLYYTDLYEKLKGYDVINANNPEFYAYGFQSYRVAKKYKKRFILRTSQTVEGFFLYKFSKYIVNPIVKSAYDYAKYLIFTNPLAEARCLRLGLLKNTKKSIVTGHPTDVKCFKPMKRKKREKIVLLSVAALIKLKGHQIIIRALKKIINKGYKNIELWIVGKGYYEKYLQNLAKKLNVDKNVKFLGSKGHNELAKIYNLSDIFVLANFQEITPAVNEALASEVPVVVMECGGCRFVIPNEKYGLITKRFDIDDMASKIIRFINDNKFAKKTAEKGRRHVIKNFSLEKVAEKTYKAYTN